MERVRELAGTVPPTGRSVVARVEESLTIEAALSGPSAGLTVAVTGPAGIGKATFVRSLGLQIAPRYAGIAHLDATTAGTLVAGIAALAPRLDGAPIAATAAGTADCVLDYLVASAHGKAWLLVFSGLEDPALWRRWRPRGETRGLITCRVPPAGFEGPVVALEPWGTAATLELLARVARRPIVATADAERLATALDGLPFSLALAASALAADPRLSVIGYLQRIERHREPATAAGVVPPTVHMAIWEALTLAEREVEASGAILALAAYAAGGEVPESLYVGPAERYPPELGPALRDPRLRRAGFVALTRYGLLQVDSAGHHRVHALTCAVLRDALGEAGSGWESAARAAQVPAGAPVVETATEAVLSRVAALRRPERATVTNRTGLAVEPPAEDPEARAVRIHRITQRLLGDSGRPKP